MFSVCLSVHTWGGTYLPDGGGLPTLRSGWGGYLPSQVWVGGTYSQVWMGGGVPMFPGPGGGYLLKSGWGVPT